MTSAAPETVFDSGAGFTYRTEEELLRAMEALRADASLRQRLGERGHRAFVERWSEEAHMRSYFGLIDEARSARRKGAPAFDGAEAPA